MKQRTRQYTCNKTPFFCVRFVPAGGTKPHCTKFPWQWRHMAALCRPHLLRARRVIRAGSRQVAPAPSLILASFCGRQEGQFTKGAADATAASLPRCPLRRPQPLLERGGKEREQRFAKYLSLRHRLEASRGIFFPCKCPSKTLFGELRLT